MQLSLVLALISALQPSVRLGCRSRRAECPLAKIAADQKQDMPLAEAERWESELEPVLLDSDLSFAEKCAQLDEYFSQRPLVVAGRVAQYLTSAAKVSAVWTYEGLTSDAGPAERLDVLSVGRDEVGGSESRRGAVLRAEISKQGVLAVKLAQTLATRPDVIGDEAAAALAVLQDSNVPFSDEEAFAIVAEDLRCAGPLAARWVDDPSDVRPATAGLTADARADGEQSGSGGAQGAADAPLFHSLTRSPVAAASLAQVYKACTWTGVEVALKVRRPRLAAQVALDVHVLRSALGSLETYWGSGTDIVGISDEVCRGVFGELDLRREAANAHAFAAAHVHLPGVVVPRHAPSLSARRVMTSEWVDGSKLPDLEVSARRRMVAAGLDACFAQLLGTGVVHADPHYGNMLWTADGRLALLDFGLVTTVTPAQSEAMA
jgi:predicted unusual protein kinase regulating ubiquinone biosynthesis (AarF/ABC1/UbiB family)